MESEQEEGIRKTGNTVEGEEVGEIYHDAVKEEEDLEEEEEDLEEEEKEEKMETRKEKRRVTEYAGITRRRRTCTRARYTDDVMRNNNRDKSKARCACTDVSIRQRRAVKGLENHARRTTMSQDSTSPDGTGCVTGQMVKSIEEGGRHCRRYKHCI